MRARLLICAAIIMLAGCGKIFPPGERLLPATYGPPFGAALKDNQPHHPHNPASAERHSQAYSGDARRYRSHAACHAALIRLVTPYRDKGRVVRISAIESLGLYEAGGEVHERRCADYVMSARSWCAETPHGGGGHAEAHKRADACGGESQGH